MNLPFGPIGSDSRWALPVAMVAMGASRVALEKQGVHATKGKRVLQPVVHALQADLKGANVLLKSAATSNYDPRGYVCKLADFGLSRVMESNATHVSTATYGTAA